MTRERKRRSKGSKQQQQSTTNNTRTSANHERNGLALAAGNVEDEDATKTSTSALDLNDNNDDDDIGSETPGAVHVDGMMNSGGREITTNSDHSVRDSYEVDVDVNGDEATPHVIVAELAPQTSNIEAENEDLKREKEALAKELETIRNQNQATLLATAQVVDEDNNATSQPPSSYGSSSFSWKQWVGILFLIGVAVAITLAMTSSSGGGNDEGGKRMNTTEDSSSIIPNNEDTFSSQDTNVNINTPTSPTVSPSTAESSSSNNPWTTVPTPTPASLCSKEESAFQKCFEELCGDATACEECLENKINMIFAADCSDFSDILCPAIVNECPCDRCNKETENWLACLFGRNGDSLGCPFSCGAAFDIDPTTSITARYFMHFLSTITGCSVPGSGVTVTATCGAGGTINLIGASPDISCQKILSNVLECTSMESVFNGADLASGFAVGALVNFACIGATTQALEAIGSVLPYRVPCNPILDQFGELEQSIYGGKAETHLQLGYGCGGNLVQSHSNCSGEVDIPFGYCKADQSRYCSDGNCVDGMCHPCSFDVSAVNAKAGRSCC